MGRIAPRKRKSAMWDYQALLRRGLNVLWRSSSWFSADAIALPAMLSLRPRLRTSLKKLWHIPDGYRWMEPLPYPHRRGILISAALLLLVLLWPYSPQPSPTPAATDAPPSTRNVMQAELADNAPPPAAAPPQAEWRQYQIASGQTLAQLFRDNNLPVNDVFAMAQVEGRDKPLSNLRVGQEIKLQLNAQGMVAELEIVTADNQVVRFSRQPDGAFIRTR